MKLEITTANAQETESLAEKIGKCLKGGEVVELTSDLGGGKTTFVRGLAKGFGSMDRVASPTFTISKVYKSGSREMHHFDFYRLPEAGLMTHELEELVGEKDIVLVIEWSKIVQDVLPADRLSINIKLTKDDKRLLQLDLPESLAYLVQGVPQ